MLGASQSRRPLRQSWTRAGSGASSVARKIGSQGGAESNRHDRGCSHPDHARAHPSSASRESNPELAPFEGAASTNWARCRRCSPCAAGGGNAVTMYTNACRFGHGPGYIPPGRVSSGTGTMLLANDSRRPAGRFEVAAVLVAWCPRTVIPGCEVVAKRENPGGHEAFRGRSNDVLLG